MKTGYVFILLVSMAILFSGYLSAPEPVAADSSCYLQANTRYMYVIVYDADRRGNKGVVIWKGWIGERKQQLIESNSGRIRYHYALDENQPPSGDRGRLCENGKIIAVP